MKSAATFLLLLLPLAAYATDDDDCHGNCGGNGDTVVDVTTTTNVGDTVLNNETLTSVGGNKNLALAAPGLGDVDIAQCLGSTQWSLLIGGRQKLVLNQVCMAEFYLKNGKYDLAAQALCNQPEILVEYDTEAQCEIAHDFTPPIVEGSYSFEPTEAAVVVYDDHDEQDDELIHDTAQALAELKSSLDQEKQARKAYAVQQQKLAQADAQYSQQVLEKLRSIDN